MTPHNWVYIAPSLKEVKGFSFNAGTVEQNSFSVL